MEAWLDTINWDNLFPSNNSVNEMWKVFTDIMDIAIEKFVPKNVKNSKQLSKWSFKTRKAYSNKIKTWRKFKTNKSKQNSDAFYKAARDAKCSSFLDIEKSEQKILDSGNIKHFYNFVNSKLTSKNSIPPLKSNNKLYSDPREKANLLQDHFASVFTIDDKNLPAFGIKTDKILDNFRICEETVLKALKKLPTKTSCGPDGIPPLIIKKVARSISLPLSKIFDLSVQTGILPNQWLEAKVIPIFKKGENSNPSNYRPISLTVAASKALELIIKAEIMSFLNANKLITTKQHGFLSRRSTLTNVLETLNKWFKARLNRKNVHCVYIDYAKAFDSVSHPKLLLKLKNYGITGKILQWIKAFLTNRSQFVCIENTKSKTCSVTSGVPQGTILGPILFLLYVNDLNDCILNSEISLYADDAKIFDTVSYDVPKSFHLQEDLDRIQEWSNRWQLTVAFHKCSVFVFGNSTDTPEYSLGNIKLDVVNEITDLGFLLSSNHKFSTHCDKIYKKAMRISAHIFRVFKTRKTKFLLNMFNTYVRPLVEYGVQIWSPYLLKDIDIVERVQRSFTKRIPQLRNLSYGQRLEVLSISSLEHRRIISDLTLVFKIIRNQIDINFDDFFSYSNDASTRSHNLRLSAPFAFNNSINAFFSYRVIKIWNNLPTETVSAKNLVVFKKLLSKFDFQSFLRGRGVR